MLRSLRCLLETAHAVLPQRKTANCPETTVPKDKLCHQCAKPLIGALEQTLTVVVRRCFAVSQFPDNTDGLGKTVA